MALFPFRVLGQLTTLETEFVSNLAGLSYAQGDILYYNGTDLTRLPAGTSGWFLKTQGAGANPTWVAVPGGGDMLAATYDALGIAGQIAGKNYANSFTKSQAILPDSDAISLAVRRNGAGQTAKILEIQSEVNATLASFDKDGKLAVPEVTIDASGNLNFGAVTVIDDNAGTTTLQNIDAIDATTETTLEAALDFAPVAHSHEGTAILSTGEVGGTKYLREDGDGTCSWQTIAAGGNVSKVGTPVDNQIGVWTGDGTIEGTSGLTFTGSTFEVTRTDAGASGPYISLYHDTSSPAISDITSEILFYGKDSGGNKQQYASIRQKTVDVTNGTEEGSLVFQIASGGVPSDELVLKQSSLSPASNDGLALGISGTAYSDVFLASGGVINWNAGNATVTHSAGLLTSNVALSLGTANALTTGTIELGHASDTTIARSGAGAITVEGVQVVLVNTSPTLATITTTGNIELGHASDTTLSRVSAGVVAVEGVTVPTISSTNTLTNKRVTKRVGGTTSSGTPTINTDNYDIYQLTAQAADITSFTTNLSGTPTDGQTLIIQITGTAARAITWGASFEASTVALPTTTVTTARLDVGFIWNTVTSKWRCIAAA